MTEASKLKDNLLHKLNRLQLVLGGWTQVPGFLSLLCRKGGKLQKRGKVNLIGRLQLTTEKTKEEDNESIVALRILRTQARAGAGWVGVGRGVS